MEQRFTNAMTEQEIENAVKHLQEYCEGSVRSALFWIAYGVYKGATMSEVEKIAHYMVYVNEIEIGEEEFFFGEKNVLRFLHRMYTEESIRYIALWKWMVLKDETLNGYNDWREEYLIPKLVDETIANAYFTLHYKEEIYYIAKSIQVTNK